MNRIRLGTGTVAASDIVALASGQARTEVLPDVIERLQQARSALDQAAASGSRIYGMNTGLGAKVGIDLAEDPAAFQNQLVRGRAIGVGEPLPTRVVRAMIAARCAMLAQGGSGISVPVFQALCALLDKDVHPVVPARGSMGASDLGLLAHVALVLIGEGQAEHRGEVLAGAEALRRAGLAPVALAPKDGLSLISSSAHAVGHAALAVQAASALLAWQEGAAALAFIGMRGNAAIFDPRLQLARPAGGQVDAAARLRQLLEGSAAPAAKLQDPLSFRCLAPVLGAASEAIRRARDEVEVELNAAADNPLVLSAAGTALSTGNFANPSLALAFENLGLALAQAAQSSMARFLQLSGGGRAGLPGALSNAGGAAAGFVPLQKTVMALMADIRRQAAPAMLDYWPIAEGVEDHATQAPLVVAKTEAIVAAWRHLVAIELLAAAQAVDLQEGLALAGPLDPLHQAVRSRVPKLEADRPLGPDAQLLHDWIAQAGS
ncbi:HAL/PAL/TAL family ammonia-lyase [Geminicoccus roseus]|uniref:HAL/PAL/TAL family ammonia-lyase n=1 Tax=Geminicoccus roseus TaxID=404900 RepID=UPI000411FC11|nr:aromatic amino acid lyase [Geminicoccus roseus]